MTIQFDEKVESGRNGQQLTDVLAARMMFQAMSTVGARGRIASKLGKSYGGNRDLYEALGYPLTIAFKDYLARYRRQDIAKAVIDKPVKACWRKKPILTESEDDETEFEKRWKEIVKQVKVWNRFTRVDKLASIGEYAVLLIGFDDGGVLEKPVESAKKLLYLTPYSQGSALIDRYVTDSKDERFGQPEMYKIEVRSGSTGSAGATSRQVHWSRIIHVTYENLESDTRGTPTLEAVYNRCQDLEMISGGSAEMFWRGAFPGYGFMATPGATWEKQDKTDLEDQIENYVHKLTRYMRLKNIDVKEFATQVADPSKHIDIQLQLISAATGIPIRILIGSERGELASSMDEIAWLGRVGERQEDYCEPTIIRPFADRLMDKGVLPEIDDYTVDWPDLFTKSDKDRAEIAERAAKALKAYGESMMEDRMPFTIFLKRFLGFSDEEIQQIEDYVGKERDNADGDEPGGGAGEED